MLERFLTRFPHDGPHPGPTGPTVIELMTAIGGRTFGSGLYRVQATASAARANEDVALAFPDFERRASCFGVDWMGRHYAVDAGRGEPHDPLLLRFEVGSGEVLPIPIPFSRFHDEELVDQDDVLEVASYLEWLEAGGAQPEFRQCVATGPAVPGWRRRDLQPRDLRPGRLLVPDRAALAAGRGLAGHGGHGRDLTHARAAAASATVGTPGGND